MYAIVELRGFQFRVEKDAVVRVPLLALEPGQPLVIERVLFLGGAETRVGTPTVDGSRVEAEVLEHGRDKKVIVGKLIRRRDHHRKRGHRQGYTDIKITEIVA